MVLSAEIGGVALARRVRHRHRLSVVGYCRSASSSGCCCGRAHSASSRRAWPMLGLVTLCFVVAAVMLGPTGRLSRRRGAEPAEAMTAPRYWFIAASILGATISPYLFLFYSSGAIEDKWDESYLGANRAIATVGMTFGGTIAARHADPRGAGAAAPRHHDVDDYHQLPLLLTPVLAAGGWCCSSPRWHRLLRGRAGGRPAAGLSGRAGLRLELGRGPHAERRCRFRRSTRAPSSLRFADRAAASIH